MDVTLFDDNSANHADINTAHELLVRDQDAITPLTGIKTQTDKLTFTGTQLQVITTPSGAYSTFKNEWQTEVEEGNGFSFTTPAITVSGSSEVDFCLVTNTGTNTRSLELHNLSYLYSKGSGMSVLKIYAQPTITANGTSVAVNKMKLNGTTTSGMLIYHTPTISNRGTLRRFIGASSTGSTVTEYDLGLVIPPGYSYLFTVVPAANNADHALYMDWGEHIV
jgi:hypothetical protein